MFTFELICMLLEGYLKILTLSVFFWLFKNIEKIFCVDKLLAQAQPVLTQNFRKRNPQKTPKY